jgi:succinyl-diaminopimelate desuccinylase
MESQPHVIGGGTYARDMENAIAFGALYPGDPDTMHQKNECVRIDRLIQTAKIYADAIYELAVKPEIII